MIFSFEPGLITSFQGDAVISVTLARFLRPFSRHGGSLSCSTSGIHRPLPGGFPSFRQVFRRVRRPFRAGVWPFSADGVCCCGPVIDHLKLTFVAEKPPLPHVFEQVALTAAEESVEYF
ncbi:hypothetical protein D4R89_01475 [bacterium]|nr:MAG: hypothetical protein D4R89_01475 [bacterium]